MTLLVALLVTGFTSDNGPQRRLIQLLPSSTVATGVRLKIGFGTVASEIPGGTWKPDCPFSGGVREPSQYCFTKLGLDEMLVPAYPVVLVIAEYCGFSAAPPVWLFGPVSPRTPRSQ